MNECQIRLLRRLSDKLDGADDVEIARLLNVPRGTPAKWRTGEKCMEKEAARAIAEILGENPDLIELEVYVACAPDRRSKDRRLRLLEQKRAELSQDDAGRER